MFRDWRSKLNRWSRDVLAMWYGLRDPRVSGVAKLLSLLPLLYLIMPVDLIPDVIPIIGWLDDLAMLPLASYLVRKFIPISTFEELRSRAEMTLLRWGPRLHWGLLAFVLAWFFLAALGGWMFYRAQHDAQPVRRPIPIYQFMVE